MHRWPAILSLVAIASTPFGCAKTSRASAHPEAARNAVDPMDELAAIPAVVDAEVRLVLAPIHDVDRVLEQLSTMPDRLGIDARGLRTLAAASLRDGTVAVDLDLPAEARAEVVQLLVTIRDIGDGVRKTPARVVESSKTIAAQGAKALTLVSRLNARFQAKLASPFTSADEKERIRGQLAAVANIHVQIKGVVGEAKSTVVELPARTRAALAKLASALASG